jgi:hypothetical protein
MKTSVKTDSDELTMRIGDCKKHYTNLKPLP